MTSLGALDVDQVRAGVEDLQPGARDRAGDHRGVLVGRRRRVLRAGDDQRGRR